MPIASELLCSTVQGEPGLALQDTCNGSFLLEPEPEPQSKLCIIFTVHCKPKDVSRIPELFQLLVLRIAVGCEYKINNFSLFTI
jgi:hypothetical protein